MRFATSIAWAMAALWLVSASERIAQADGNASVSIDNGILRLTVASDGTLTVDRRQGREFRPVLSGGRTFAPELRGAGRPEISDGKLTGADGPGRTIEVLYHAHGAVLRAQYGLPDRADHFTCTAWVQAGNTPLRWDRIVVLEAQLDLGPGQIRSLTHEERWVAGVNALGETRRTSQFFAAVLNRERNRGVVAGGADRRGRVVRRPLVQGRESLADAANSIWRPRKRGFDANAGTDGVVGSFRRVLA